MRRVILESPYAGDVARNERYARAALRDSLMRGEAPIASHLLYTQPGVLNDTNAAERAMGIAAGLAWGSNAEATVVYHDLGVSTGMRLGLDAAAAQGRPVEYRTIGLARDTAPDSREDLGDVDNLTRELAFMAEFGGGEITLSLHEIGRLLALARIGRAVTDMGRQSRPVSIAGVGVAA